MSPKREITLPGYTSAVHKHAMLKSLLVRRYFNGIEYQGQGRIAQALAGLVLLMAVDF